VHLIGELRKKWYTLRTRFLILDLLVRTSFKSRSKVEFCRSGLFSGLYLTKLVSSSADSFSESSPDLKRCMNRNGLSASNMSFLSVNARFDPISARSNANRFQSALRSSNRSDAGQGSRDDKMALFQSALRSSNRSDAKYTPIAGFDLMFQSALRSSNRSDVFRNGDAPFIEQVSIRAPVVKPERPAATFVSSCKRISFNPRSGRQTGATTVPAPVDQYLTKFQSALRSSNRSDPCPRPLEPCRSCFNPRSGRQTGAT
jgi:hypothetical protein